MQATEDRRARIRAAGLSIGDRAILAAALGLVFWGALAFGAVYPWAYAPLFAGAAVVGTIAFWRARAVALPRPTLAMLAALTLTAMLATAQAVPLPDAVRTTVSPANESFLREMDVRYAAAVTMREQGLFEDARALPPRPLSLNANATLRSAGMLGALALLLGGLTKFFGRTGISRVVAAIIAFAALLAVIGIVQKALLGDHAFGGMKIYGFWEPRFKLTTPFGPYVNKNHYAGWMIMAIPLAIGFVLSMGATWLRHAGRGWRDRLLWLSSPEGGRAQLVTFAVVLMGLALTMTMSRSGLGALILALLVSVLVGARQQYSLKARLLLSAALLVLLAGGVAWADLDVAGRFTSGRGSVELRRAAWRDAVAIIRDFPLTGTGLNTYGTATLKYDSTRSDLQFLEAHNDYLQIAAEGGLLLGVPVLVALICAVRSIRQRLREDAADPAAYWLRFGAIMGLLAMAIQSLVEFSLQMPGNAVFFVVLAAIALHPSPPSPGRQAAAAAAA